MVRRLIAAIIAATVLIAGTSGIAAAASTDGGDGVDGGRTRRHDMIWQGLCVGASLDLSFESQVDCARQQAQAANNPPLGPPDIATGLCVGASLDLSAASAARCKASTQAAAQRNSNLGPPNIDAGLCVGASLDFSFRSQVNCVKQAGPPPGATSFSPRQVPLPPDQPIIPHHAPSHPSPGLTTPTPPRQIQYAALGDSVAAGFGLPDPADSIRACGRTTGAYPNLLANARGLSFANFACSGAKLSDLFAGRRAPTQLSAAFAGGTPSLMTITAGANDVEWSFFINKCFTRDCGTSTDDLTFGRLNAQLAQNVQALFQQIQAMSNGSPPEVVMTGYFDPVSDSCNGVDKSITPSEINWINARTADLNQTLQNGAAQFSFVRFAPIDFSGHDVCASDPWVQSITDPAPFHPNNQGQQVIAQSIN
ncbi:MAG TPA: SGNH/GDSL hydrolase family protein [Candidatus Pristimantibacillus sp.]|nr:SGNH/GDSL hydrolase family protein [Candidatus Pristimantibacillus sp.]